MAFTINAPKNWLLLPFFVLLVIISLPFALFFSLIRLPFAKRRTIKLKEIITEDWLPRQKYVYIGYNDDLSIKKYFEKTVLPKYGEHIIYDQWFSEQGEWITNEPDTYNRVTTIWQDIVGDFDGDPICIIAVLTPKQVQITAETVDVYYFNPTKDGSVLLNEKEIHVKDVEKKIGNDIKAGLASWTSSGIQDSLSHNMPKRIYEAHKHSINHRAEIEASKICGCFYCLNTFAPDEIREWIKNDTEEFAMCPKCGIDSVIGDASGIEINNKFLREMNKYWFDGDALAENER